MGARWLLSDDPRSGKTHSSLVLYLAADSPTPRLRFGKKSYHTTDYNWDSPPTPDHNRHDQDEEGLRVGGMRISRLKVPYPRYKLFHLR